MPPAASQKDPDARFLVFLNPIRDLTKNWEVDIAKYLEEYLEELSDLRITFDGGETTMNFAEAAMLIQGSASVYSKKVEFLWQMVLQMLDLLSNKRNADVNVGAETGKKGLGKNSSHDVSQAFVMMDDIPESNSINIKDDDEDEDVEDVRKKFKFLPCTPLHLVEKETEKAQYRISLYLTNNELLGAKDDYRMNRSYHTANGVLSLDIPNENQFQMDDIQSTLENIPEENEEDFSESPALDGEVFDSNPQPEESPIDDSPPVEGETPPDPQQSPVEGESPDTNNSPLEGESADTNTPSGSEEVPMEVEESQETPTDNSGGSDIIEFPAAYGLRKRGEKEKTVVIQLKEPWKPSDPHADAPAKRPIRAGRIRKPLPCSCHAPVARSRRRQNQDEKSSKKNLAPVEKMVSSALNDACDTQTKGNLKLKDISPKILEEAIKEENKRLDTCKKKKVKDLINEGKAGNHDEAEEKLDELTQQQNDLAEQMDDGVDDMPAADFDDDELQPSMELPEPHTANLEADYGQRPPKSLNASFTGEAENEYEALVQTLVNEYILNAQEYIASSDLALRVNKWRENIWPLLEEEEKRTEFDIHEYGSKILDRFPEGKDSAPVLFDDVVEDCDNVRDIPRYFLSSLMLANTYNVELSQTIEGDSEMDCMQLKFLSRVRHHEELQEYAAPSQEVGNPSRLPPKRKGKRRSVNNLQEVIEDVNHNEADNYLPPSPSSSICSDITEATKKSTYNRTNIQKQKKENRNKKIKHMSNR